MILQVPEENYTTWAFMGLLVAAMVELVKVCMPLTLLRGILAVTAHVVLIVLSSVFGSFFALKPFDLQMIIYGMAVYGVLFLIRIIFFEKIR